MFGAGPSHLMKAAPRIPYSPEGGSDGGPWRQRVAMSAELRRALVVCGSPISFFAVAVWILNDAWLKFAFPSRLTDKLSDVAGLFVTPYLLMVVLLVAAQLIPIPAARRAAALLAFALVGLVFVGLKTDAGTASFIRANLAILTGGGTVGVLDATDLFALPLLLVSFFYWSRSAANPERISCRRYLPLLALTAFATVATTPGVPPHLQLVADPMDPRTLVALYIDVDYYGGWYPRGIFATVDAENTGGGSPTGSISWPPTRVSPEGMSRCAGIASIHSRLTGRLRSSSSRASSATTRGLNLSWRSPPGAPGSISCVTERSCARRGPTARGPRSSQAT